MKSLAEDGVGVILISSEMTESRRCAGRITGNLDAATTATETLVGAIFATGTDGAPSDPETADVH
ncbi:hypothetical protein [Paracoccus rhizosphaerae]|uniref:Uncharacterized protein n=1 Tax=Paracoccus rhizosphaerae TaxID=1133347 RepID=A0ABV6CER6_9RHOB|nr:hypothetical protein [Paracoccus rhizosphaerae]